VFVLGGHSEAWGENWNQKKMHILIPNDLMNPGAPFLSRALDLAETLQAKVTLFNAVPQPIQDVMNSGVYLLSGGWVPAPVYLQNERDEQQNTADTVLERARKRHIDCGSVVDYTAPSIVDAILKQARDTHVSFITMAAESGPVASALLGSITRQVVRSAPCPVLVFRVKD
jgi:nucleotide-binding universal stress UspA family protein